MIGSSLCRLGRRLIPVHRPMNMVLQRRYSAAAAREETRDQEEEQEEMFDQRKLPADYDPANFDPAEHRSPPSARVWRLVDEISGLTLAEVAELSGIIMRKLNMKEPPVIGVMKGGDGGGAGVAAAKGAGGKEEKKPEKSVFELKLESFDAASKIKVIKEEAKELVEKAPVVIKGGLTREEAEQIIGKMNAAGAKVVME
ncbi:unnamed protein product [Spirodela intermedia]|uniref:Large ribosomal subunit protein bL12 C-terminal domain-containing protein n=1 Tax=Spirodela intermedia TaxID=51605 RepID=A0A7I8JMN6_SPIIN|nr:unnamed protein product [Spirodela intermedia]CAA6671404.1 unnamed protein product [Spirodela intermedia]